ncbi:F-box only protein 15-like isoform X1 [Gavia stellata]|uniref:F-box only protein 15-like isoform X1 n=1 Tax=Gavia stellata TaxID=37040 RepID=UPI0028974B38|nr:F-box only protein 15-like isoform X1 [Gavia stellata]
MPAACEPVLEAIEDTVSAEDLKPRDRQFVRKNVFPKVRQRNSQKNTQADDDPPSDSGIWLKIYSGCFQPKRTIWKMKSEPPETVSLGCAALRDRKPGYWKKEYLFKQIAAVKMRVRRLVKPVDPSTGLPCKNKEAMKASGLRWRIVLKDKNGKEHVMEKANLSIKDTSVTVLWYSTNWPCLDILSSLRLFGVMPLLPEQSRAPSKNGPRRRSLIAEYHLANLTESSVAVGADELGQLFSLNPALLVGLWEGRCCMR